jgi:hypothetical protein
VTPVSKSPLNPLQRALVNRLGGDSTLSTLLTAAGRVLDQVEETTPYPYVRLGDHLSVPDNDHGGYGRQVTQTLHIWTKARGNATGQDIANRINELLDHQHDALTAAFQAPAGHRVVSIRNEFDQALTDPDPEIRHHVLRFRVITAQLT